MCVCGGLQEAYQELPAAKVSLYKAIFTLCVI